jgi:hypothetical protein
MVPAWLLEAKVSALARMVAIELLNLGALTRPAWPSLAHLSRRLGLSRRMIAYLLRELEESGILSTTERPGVVSNFRIAKPTPARGAGLPLHAVQGTPARGAADPYGVIQMKSDPEKSGPPPAAAREALSKMRARPAVPRSPKTPEDRAVMKAAGALIAALERDQQLRGVDLGKWWGRCLKHHRHYLPMLETLAQLGKHIADHGSPPGNAIGYLEKTYKEKEANYFAERSEVDSEDLKQGPTIFDAVFRDKGA